MLHYVNIDHCENNNRKLIAWSFNLLLQFAGAAVAKLLILIEHVYRVFHYDQRTKHASNDLTFRDMNTQGNSTYSLIYSSGTLYPTWTRESVIFVHSAPEKSRHACEFFHQLTFLNSFVPWILLTVICFRNFNTSSSLIIVF